MMNKIKYIIMLYTVICLGACNGDAYLEELYIAPEASFSMEKSEYQVLEVVRFANTGRGTSFVVYRETPDLQRVVMVYFPIHMMNRVSMRLYG